MTDLLGHFGTFTWSAPRARAAVLVATDELADEQIAAEVGINRRQLTRWKAHPTFTARVAELAKEYEERTLTHGIARRLKRVEALNERWRKMQAVIAARAKEYADPSIPGGDTGLLVRQVKLSPSGAEVVEYVVDTGLLKELREHEKQAAQELGQWTEKSERTGKNGGPVVFTMDLGDTAYRDKLHARVAAIIARREELAALGFATDDDGG